MTTYFLILKQMMTMRTFYNIATLSLLFAFAHPVFATTAKDGGVVTIWPKDHGTFLFVDTQKRVPHRLFEKPVRIVSGQFDFDIQLSTGVAPEIRGVKATLKRLQAKGAVWIVDDPDLPVMIGACEDGWGYINVAPLLADTPDDSQLANRIEKVVNRTFAQIQGAATTTMTPHCVMMASNGISGIDELSCPQLSPEPVMKISPCMESRGYKACFRGTYLEACELGLAAEPTNDIQRVIWEKVHALPSNPIKIKPETKKVLK